MTLHTQRDRHAYDDAVVIPALQMALGLDEPMAAERGVYFSAETIDVTSYDTIVVCVSGGKDSLACLLRLFELGADRSKMECWHHDVDAREEGFPQFMDWPFVTDFNRVIGASFGVPVYFSWLRGGFLGEMLKQDAIGQPHVIETPEGRVVCERDEKRATPSTRMRFPQVTASLQTRWCSSALKIDVGRRALTRQSRFEGQRVLFVTGERRQESAARSGYNQLEPHACDRRKGRKARHVDHWRPILHWGEEEVWDILRRHRVIAPPPYRIGWSRSSCQTCIFSSPRIWATLARYFPERAATIEQYERYFGTTISRSGQTVLEIAARARPLEIMDMEALDQATREDYTLPFFVAPGEAWKLPAGAFQKEGCGAT